MTIRNSSRWLVTGLMAALMVLSAVPDVIQADGALAVFRHLGYPPYLLRFLGTAKLLGVAMVVFPTAPRLKEWAFAGLTFDLTGALYSHLSVGDPPSAWLPAVIGLLLMTASYVAYRALERSRLVVAAPPRTDVVCDEDRRLQGEKNGEAA